MISPPILSKLLVTGYNEITAQAGSQIADHRGLDVNSPFHRRRLHLIANAGNWLPNAPAHRERPERVLSDLAESQRGRDAVARRVRLGFAARVFPHFLSLLVLFRFLQLLLYTFASSL